MAALVSVDIVVPTAIVPTPEAICPGAPTAGADAITAGAEATPCVGILPTAGSLVLTIAGVFPVPAGAVPAAPAGGFTPGAADAPAGLAGSLVFTIPAVF